MAVGKFLDTWLALHAYLQEHADEIGVHPDSIVLGNWQAGQETALVPPGVIVYMIPGDPLGTTPRVEMATAKLFPVTQPAATIAEASGMAVDMGWRVVKVVKRFAAERSVMVRWPPQKVSLDTVTASITASRVEVAIEYQTT